MLPKKNRFDGRIENSFFYQAKKVFSDIVTLYYLPNDDLSEPQMAIVASKKNFRTSVQRHQVKRKLRENLRKKMVDWPIGQYVWVLKSNFLKLTAIELEHELKIIQTKIKW